MSVSDHVEWLLGLERLGMKFGLETIEALVAALGDPHLAFPAIHVAGTNGKGSVTAMLDASLRAAGYRSARYTSPHLVRLEERFVVDGEEVTPARIDGALGEVRRAAESLEGRGALEAPATFFECATAAAFVLFRDAAVDVAVLEAGLGGRLDATNVARPLVTAITTIDFDHQAQLGSTIEAIAAEKAGIIKPATPIVIGRLPAPAEDLIAARARLLDAPMDGPPLAVRPSLAGAHQVDNARVAAAVLRLLRERGFAVGDHAIERGIGGVRWPGRLEHRRYGSTDILVDAAHNPAGARALASYLEEAGWAGAALVFGAMADKDAAGMLGALAPRVGRIICTTAPSARAAAAGTLAGIAERMPGAPPVEAIDDPEQALARASRAHPRVVIAGSIFLIGPLRGILR